MADFIDIADNKLRTAVINEYSRLICASNRSHREQKELRKRLISEALANSVVRVAEIPTWLRLGSPVDSASVYPVASNGIGTT